MQSPHGPPAPQCPCGGPQTRPGPPPGRSTDRGGRLLEAGAGRAAGDDGSGLNEHKEKRTEGSDGQSQICFKEQFRAKDAVGEPDGETG